MLWLVPSSGGLDLSQEKNLGLIVSPLNGLSPVRRFNLPFAIDNGAFGGKFNPDAYRQLLHDAEPYQERCLFAVAPDEVANAVVTDRLWQAFSGPIRSWGYKVAYVAQDGIDQPPWDELDCLFIGGTTEFKLSDQVLALLAAAGERGKWRHVGRVNSAKRLRHFWGRAESFDGTDWCRGPRIKLDFYKEVMRLESLQARFWEAPCK